MGCWAPILSQSFLTPSVPKDPVSSDALRHWSPTKPSHACFCTALFLGTSLTSSRGFRRTYQANDSLWRGPVVKMYVQTFMTATPWTSTLGAMMVGPEVNLYWLLWVLAGKVR